MSLAGTLPWTAEARGEALRGDGHVQGASFSLIFMSRSTILPLLGLPRGRISLFHFFLMSKLRPREKLSILSTETQLKCSRWLGSKWPSQDGTWGLPGNRSRLFPAPLGPRFTEEVGRARQGIQGRVTVRFSVYIEGCVWGSAPLGIADAASFGRFMRLARVLRAQSRSAA